MTVRNNGKATLKFEGVLNVQVDSDTRHEQRLCFILYNDYFRIQ